MKPFPTDLIIEISSRLPGKSVGRFRTLSKEWCSILSRPDFIKLFDSRSGSCTRPRLMFAVERQGSWNFFSSPQPCPLSLVVTAEFHSRFSKDISRSTCSYASGLFYFNALWLPKVGRVSLVCNPITGRYMILPDVDMYRNSRGFIGFEPVEKEFKVLAEGFTFCNHRDHHEVLTLGTGDIPWSPKGTKTLHYDRSVGEGICINGVLYYLIIHFDKSHSIVHFDVSSEEFKCLHDPYETSTSLTTYMKLINYKGKLGVIDCNYGEDDGMYTLDLYMFVLEDVESEEWSEYEYTLPENKLLGDTSNISVVGATDTGEIVLAMNYTCKPYYVFYFNLERNTLRSVEIQGFGAFAAVEYRGRVSAFLDHVEDPDVDDSLQLNSTGTFSNPVKRLCSNCEEQKDNENRDK